MHSIDLCTAEDLQPLRRIAIKTFVDTYGRFNTPEIMAHYLEEAFSEDQLLVEILNPDSEFYVLKVDGSWAGYIKLNAGQAQTEERTDEAIELERIYVDRAFQGKGFGKLLIDKAMEVAQAKKKETVWLGVWEENPKAIQFYESQGFDKTGTHSFVLGGEVQQDWVMERAVDN